jgi:N-acetylmuramoyl-L-alanine amidase
MGRFAFQAYDMGFFRNPAEAWGMNKAPHRTGRHPGSNPVAIGPCGLKEKDVRR